MSNFPGTSFKNHCVTLVSSETRSELFLESLSTESQCLTLCLTMTDGLSHARDNSDVIHSH